MVVAGAEIVLLTSVLTVVVAVFVLALVVMMVVVDCFLFGMEASEFDFALVAEAAAATSTASFGNKSEREDCRDIFVGFRGAFVVEINSGAMVPSFTLFSSSPPPLLDAGRFREGALAVGTISINSPSVPRRYAGASRLPLTSSSNF